MSHITYHYLLNKTNKTATNNSMDLNGNYLYDLNCNPDKKKQEIIYKGYLNQFLSSAPEELVKLCKQRKSLKDQVNFWFEMGYKKNFEKVLGRPYFGVFGLYTTPADLLTTCYRLKIDLDTIDPDVLVIRFGNGNYKYNESNWNKYCKPFIHNKEKSLEFVKKGSFKVLPSVVIFLPKLKFNKEDIEEYNP